MKISRYAFALVALGALSCSGGVGGLRIETVPQSKPIPTVVLQTTGASLGAADGSFRLVAGQPAKPPFVVALPAGKLTVEVNADPQYSGWFPCVMSRYHATCVRRAAKGVVGAWKAFLAAGAKRVTISLKDRNEVLHGVLYLGEVPTTARGRTSLVYEIELPPERVAEATPTTVSAMWGESLVPNKGTVRTWILWLSGAPFE